MSINRFIKFIQNYLWVRFLFFSNACKFSFRNSILYNVVTELIFLTKKGLLTMFTNFRTFFSSPYVFLYVTLYFLFFILPMMLLTFGYNLFIRFYNYMVFMFHFLSSAFFLTLDIILFLLYTIFCYPYHYLRGKVYRFFLFVLNRFGFLSYYFISSLFFFLFSFLFILLGYVVVFQFFFPFYGGYIYYDVGSYLDIIKGYSNNVGAYYFSNYWWYFRGWILYGLVFLIFPRSRVYIREHVDLILFLPFALYLYDNWMFNYTVPEPYNKDGRLYPEQTFLRSRDGGTSLDFYFPFISRYIAGRYMEPPLSGYDYVYSNRLSSQPVSEDSSIRTRFPYEGADSTQRFSGNIEVQNIRGSYDWDALYRYAHFGTEHNYFSQRGRNLVYVLNPGEADYLVNDFNDVIPISEMYYDEKYYYRMIKDIETGVFYDRVMPYSEYIDLLDKKTS